MLDIQNLSIGFSRYTFGLRKEDLCVIRSFDLSIRPGQLMAVIGQSGAGKSLLAHCILGVLPRNARVSGEINFKGEPLTPKRLKTLRGREIALIPQSVTALNPLRNVGVQVARAAQLAGIGKKDAKAVIRRILKRYRLPEEVAGRFPFQLSGGMAHRVLTAIATIGEAQLILADEPTSGLDPTTARETLGHMRELADAGKAVLLISHDVETALEVADRVAVFYNGTTVEVTDAKNFENIECLRHPYTKALWNALPANGFLSSETSPPAGSHRGGCPFQMDCDRRKTKCGQCAPELQAAGAGWVRCHHA
jgi:peptide/nickel transport system ATP-binding protein